MTVDVRHNPDRRRFEAWVDGSMAGFTRYYRRRGVVVVTHTEVDPAHRGEGVAAALAAAALDHIRAAGEKIVAICPYVAAYLREHPEQQDLLAGGQAGDG